MTAYWSFIFLPFVGARGKRFSLDRAGKASKTRYGARRFGHLPHPRRRPGAPHPPGHEDHPLLGPRAAVRGVRRHRAHRSALLLEIPHVHRGVDGPRRQRRPRCVHGRTRHRRSLRRQVLVPDQEPADRLRRPGVWRRRIGGGGSLRLRGVDPALREGRSERPRLAGRAQPCALVPRDVGGDHPHHRHGRDPALLVPRTGRRRGDLQERVGAARPTAGLPLRGQHAGRRHGRAARGLCGAARPRLDAHARRRCRHQRGHRGGVHRARPPRLAPGGRARFVARRAEDRRPLRPRSGSCLARAVAAHHPRLRVRVPGVLRRGGVHTPVGVDHRQQRVRFRADPGRVSDLPVRGRVARSGSRASLRRRRSAWQPGLHRRAARALVAVLGSLDARVQRLGPTREFFRGARGGARLGRLHDALPAGDADGTHLPALAHAGGSLRGGRAPRGSPDRRQHHRCGDRLADHRLPRAPGAGLAACAGGQRSDLRPARRGHGAVAAVTTQGRCARADRAHLWRRRAGTSLGSGTPHQRVQRLLRQRSAPGRTLDDGGGRSRGSHHRGPPKRRPDPVHKREVPGQ